ncbi:unnamed protein product [Moneuplotes crassus]|uniref:Calpain catalytic domain-containing protein n=1 Tax=Euplotes crassus TaxID=5936 RepID=A0AAD1X292_EUPCR|nr:unnamed protein product [Moneuplotes crassus]
MPGKDKAKGVPKGKQGTALKDILPPNAKQPREGDPFDPVEEPEGEDIENEERHYEYLPYLDFPAWPGDEEVQQICDEERDKIVDEVKNSLGEDGHASGDEDNLVVPDEKLFFDDYKFYLPPSYLEFEKKKVKWKRPRDYIQEIIDQKEGKKKKEKKSGGSNSRASDIMNKSPDDAGAKKKKQKPQERPETEEEMKIRKEEEEKAAGKDKKKAPKKGEDEEQPQMARVAIECNMDMGFLMPTYSKWMTSQIQFIKDRTVRDSETKEQIWKRIYPQENGIPCKSLNGKYRVKLRFMGQERLVEIDDRMPCDIHNKLMYPRTTDFTEIWPHLLIKAFFKLYSFKWYPGALYDRETGDTSLMYCLTGLVGERIKVDNFHQDGIEILRKHLSDEYYFDNKTYVMTYCGITFKPKIPSMMKVEKPGQDPKTGISPQGLAMTKMVSTQKLKLATKLREIASLALSITTGKRLTPAILTKQRQSYVIPGFGYALMDLFENRTVDMNTIIKKIDNDDAKSPFRSPNRGKKKVRKQSPNMNKTMTLKKKSSKRKGRLTGLKDKSRTQAGNIKKVAPIQYKLLKIRTSVGNYPILNVNAPFTNSEIKLANKCRLNGWERPPPEFDPNFVPEQSPTKDNNTFKLDITPIKEENETGDKVDENEENKEEENKDEKKAYEPRTRAPGGIWLQASDFPYCFQYFIIFHNEQKIKHRNMHRDVWTMPKKPYVANEDDVYIRVREMNEEEKKAEEEAQPEEDPSEETEQYKNIEDYKKDDKKRVLVSFTPNPTKTDAERLPRYYCRLDVEKTEKHPAPEKTETEDNNIVLSDLQDSEEDSDPLNQNDLLFTYYFSGKVLEFPNLAKIILKPHIYAPLGFFIGISSDCKIDILNHTQYCIEEQKLHSKKYEIQQGNLQKEKYSLLFKFDFNPTEQDTECQFILRTADKYLYNFMRLKIIDKSCPDDDLGANSQLSLNQKLSESSSITTLNLCRTEKITFQPNEDKGYSIICEGILPYDVFGIDLELEMITNREELELERIEMVEPLLYSDEYVPYKYGIIFKEKIYVGQHTSAAMNIALKQKCIVEEEVENKAQADIEIEKAEDPPKEEDKQDEEGAEPIFEIRELKKNFKVEIFDNEELIQTYQGNGHLTISHFNFRSNSGLEEKPEPKKESEGDEAPPADGADVPEEADSNTEYAHHYVIQATFDKNDWPGAVLKNSPETKDIEWDLSVFSSDTVAIVKDTDKEDREQALKDSWEEAEPGRAEKSKKSRIRYLAELKKSKGEELTEEEQEVINETRIRGAANLGEAQGDPKAAKGKGDKKGATPEEDEKVEEVPQVFPTSSDYTNLHFRDFIHHFESDRLIHIKCNKSGARLRDEAEILERKALKEKEVEQWEKVFSTRMENREIEAKDREEKQKQLQDIIMKSREDFITKTEELFAKRNEYRELISNRKYKEVLLNDVMGLEKIEIAALETALSEAKEALVNKETIETAEKKLEVLKYSKGVEEELQAATSEKDADKMRQLIAKIEEENLIVEPKILNDSKNALAKIK